MTLNITKLTSFLFIYFSSSRVVPGLGKKHLRYAYDLLSGNVRQVYYQEGQPDAFYHRYEYDADNRLLGVETSTDAYHWEQDAAYDYYAHGPLRRVELGHDQVQGLDYTYTIHGWLKAINHPVLNSNADPGADGPNGTGQDAFGMSLGYYQGDYKNNDARYQSLGATSDALIDRNLYNGNIAAWASDAQENALAAQQGNLKYTGLTGQQYRYDELNRLVGSTFRQYQNGSWQSPASASEYGSSYSYDASGNLQTLNRSAYGSNPLIDRLQYHYQAGTNKLDYVTDAAGHPTIRDDFQPGQQAGNYAYDAIGNLTKDEQEGITQIAWTVYGKVQQITKQDGSQTTYRYDATGNRSSKQYTNAEGQEQTTYYVRDASGNVMAIYQASGQERCLVGQVSATKRYDPSVWEDGELALGQSKQVYLPQEIQVTAGSSGNHQLTLYYIDAQGVEQTVLYRGGASASHAYNQAGTSRNEGQYQQGQRYVFQSSSNGVVADELIQVQSLRVSINNGDSWDPSGQTSVVMKLYEPCAGLMLAEQPIYGSDRLGMYRAEKLLSQEPTSVTPTGNVAYITGDISINSFEGVYNYVLAEGVEMTVGKDFSFSYAERQQEFSIRFGEVETQGMYYARETGKKQYELKDHLGNVRVLVSDKKLSEDIDGDGVGDVSKAEILASYEYYSFGMLQPGRTFNPSESRFGFNGKEKDQSFGATNYDFGARIYNPQLGRWLSLDPLQSKYPSLSPYNFVNNSPLRFVDPDGKRFIFALGACSDCSNKGYGESFVKILRALGVKNVTLASARGVMSNDEGSYLQMLGDQLFTMGDHASTPYTNMTDNISNLSQYGGAISREITGLDAADSRIKDYYNNVLSDLTTNPLEDGEQLNLAGVSAGSVLTAQTALLLANEGTRVDNVILIGSPISEDSELFKSLKNNSNIGNVILKNLEDDPITNAGSKSVGEKIGVMREIGSQGDGGKHVQFSNDPKVREKIAKELVDEGIK